MVTRILPTPKSWILSPKDANVKIPNSNKIPNDKLSSALTVEKVTLNYGPWMVVAQKGRNQNGKGKEKIQDYANHQNGNLNRGSKFGVLLVDDDGGNNQNEGNEFLIAILSNKVPIITDPHALNESKHSAIRKNSLDQNLVDKQPSRTQYKKKMLPKQPIKQIFSLKQNGPILCKPLTSHIPNLTIMLHKPPRSHPFLP